MSKLFVDQVDPKTATTLTLGTSGDTISIPSGVTIANAGTATGFGVSLANGANDRVVTASSASALNGEANLTYNGTILGVGGTGDLGTGVHVKASDTGGTVSANSDNLVLEENGNVGLTMLSANNGTGHIFFGNGADEDEGYITYDSDNNRMRFGVNAAERARIDGSGILYIQTTAAPSSSVQGTQIANTNSGSKFGGGSGTSTQNVIIFYNGNGEVGKIFTNGTGTTYNTSSDYRRKENVNYTWDATTRLKQLKPARFNFKADTDTTLDGFLAHEVSSIVPDAVTGVKDETENKKNVVLNPVGDIAAEGITEAEWTQGKADGTYLANSTWHGDKDVPVYQAIDQSKLVPLLVKTIQELEARITTLENA